MIFFDRSFDGNQHEQVLGSDRCELSEGSDSAWLRVCCTCLEAIRVEKEHLSDQLRYLRIRQHVSQAIIRAAT